MADPTSRAPADPGKEDELVDLVRRLVVYLAEFTESLPFALDRQKLRSITTLAAIAITSAVAWKILRTPQAQQRRQRRQPASSSSLSSSRSGRIISPSEVYSSSRDSMSQYAVDEFFQPLKLTLEQVVRHRLNEGRKVTCCLAGVVLEESTPEELQKSATVRSSVLEVLLEITKFCDVYLMERILDDESGERVLSALDDSGVFAAGGLLRDKVLFCSTDNGRTSFVRQLEPDWHIDSNPDIIQQLARFIKYQLHVTPSHPGHIASNVYTSASLEQFFGRADQT